MSMMANSAAMQAMRIQPGDGLDRNGATAPRQAGELAGQFAAMLEAMNGVSDVGVPTADRLDTIAAMPSAQPEMRLGIGAVSLFAQDIDGATATDAGQTPDLPPQDPANLSKVVESAIQAGDGSNFRWLTTLLTQNAEA